MTEQNKELDFLAIGDIVIDAFIKLSDAEVICDENKQNCKLAVRYGDKVPYDSVEICNAVGNAPNAATSAGRLGLNSAILTYLGDDQNGKDCIDQLKANNVSTDFVNIEAGKKTNYHYALWFETNRTILVKHEKFDYKLPNIGKPKWIYISSLGESALDMYKQIADYLEKNPEVNLAFQPGIFDMKQGTEKLSHIYSRANIICVNVEEAQRILGEKSRDLKTLLKGMSNLGPNHILITDGFDGAYAYEKEKDEAWFMPVYPHTPFESTGAGDAFFSTIVSCLAMGKSLSEALSWGPINSMSVVQQVGAQKGLLSSEKLEEFLAKAPESYKLSKI